MIFSDGNFDYNTVFNQMTPEEVEEANVALDIYNDALQRAAKKR